MKRIISISLGLLMLVSNVGFTMNTHFCGGEAVETSFSIGLHNPDCGMPDMDRDCETIPYTEEQIKSKPCCENQHQLLHLDENADVQATSVEFNPVFLLHSYIRLFSLFYLLINLLLITPITLPPYLTRTFKSFSRPF